VTATEILAGCGDHSCVVARPKGMGTNGGCRCEPTTLRRALRAEQKRSANLRQTLDDRGDAMDRAEALADRFAAEGDAMRNIAVDALARMSPAVPALHATLAVPRACRSCGKPVEPLRQCYAVPTCYACLPPPPPLDVAEVPR
jgi:hypothetical protein